MFLLPAWTIGKNIMGFFFNTRAGQYLGIALLVMGALGWMRHEARIEGRAEGKAELQAQIDRSNAKIEQLEQEAKDAANRVGPTPSGSDALKRLCDLSADCRRKKS